MLTNPRNKHVAIEAERFDLRIAPRAGFLLGAWRKGKTLRRAPLALLFALAVTWFVTSAARANIYEWARIPGDPAWGKMRSTTLCPGGAGVDAEPGAYLYGLDLTQAYLIGANLTGANLEFTTLTTADVTSAILTDAMVRGADFSFTTASGFTAAQLYSTAS